MDRVGETGTLSTRRAFWTGYQPGFRFSDSPVGSAEFFDEVERHRYALEPHIEEMAAFDRWSGHDVVEAGCGIATDGMRFVRAGARYTGVDFSPAALELARKRLEHESGQANFVQSSITSLPFPHESFDLAYSNGVIHHLPETRRAVEEMHRVLRPGGTAVVMVYHRNSLNFFFTIMVLRRLLAGLLLLPGAERAIAAATGEAPATLQGHRQLLREQGLSYLTDARAFLSHNTDGPGNPLSKVYSARGARALFSDFASVETSVRFLNLRAYPGGDQLARSRTARRLERRYGWHLWIEATKGGGPQARDGSGQ